MCGRLSFVKSPIETVTNDERTTRKRKLYSSSVRTGGGLLQSGA